MYTEVGIQHVPFGFFGFSNLIFRKIPHFPNHQVIQVGHLFPNLNRLRQVSVPEHQPGCHLVLCADLRRWSKIAGSVSYTRTWASQNWEYTSNIWLVLWNMAGHFPFHIWDI
jgi:hypothetical protein